MPEAAWCSACQKHVWVSPEGWCQFGHDPRFLSGGYTAGAAGEEGTPVEHASIPISPLAPDPVQPPSSGSPGRPPKPRRWVLPTLFGAFALLIIGGIALATWAAFDALHKVEIAANQELMERSQQNYANTHINSGSTDAEEAPAAAPVEPELPPLKRMTQEQWDAFVAKEYPDYRVAERFEKLDQYHSGLNGVDYVLVNKRHPRFRLFVSFAQLERGDSLDTAPDAYVDVLDGVFTSDGLFSVDAAKHTTYLRQQGQDAIIEAFIAKSPVRSPLAFGGFGDEGEVFFVANVGEDQVSRAQRDYTAGDLVVSATIPHGPRNSVTIVDITEW